MWLQTKHFIQQGFFMFHTQPFTQPAMKLKKTTKKKNSSLNHLMDSTFIFTLK